MHSAGVTGRSMPVCWRFFLAPRQPAHIECMEGQCVSSPELRTIMKEPDELEEENEGPDDQWQEFRDDDSEPIRVEELTRLDMKNLPEEIVIRIQDDYFPDTSIWREGESLVCEIEEHLYTKYWEHKFSAYAFAEAMERAVRRLSNEGHPFSEPTRDDDDAHIFVRWKFTLPLATPHDALAASIKSAFDLVWSRADAILENSDSVLILGKDSGPALDRLKRIAGKLYSRA